MTNPIKFELGKEFFYLEKEEVPDDDQGRGRDFRRVVRSAKMITYDGVTMCAYGKIKHQLGTVIAEYPEVMFLTDQQFYGERRKAEQAKKLLDLGNLQLSTDQSDQVDDADQADKSDQTEAAEPAALCVQCQKRPG